MIKYFTLPGYGNSGPEHWQTYFEQKLDNCHRIEQDSWDKPVLEDWLTRIEEVLQHEDLSNTILITHSLGGITLAHWIAKYKRTIKGALIVAPPDIENPHEDFGVHTFLPLPLNALPFKSIVAYSTNDVWCAKERALFFAKQWGSSIVEIGEAGHVNDAAGYGAWPDGLELLKTLV
ncbi:RBBP9/YdeN family alpha/beta hydrolase [Saccharicrinis aurantiacus]|uniref:RBBP9/YdeN family alpha/beta hydrolase n=1 Tax=Saccharicrinis aurantiacus TaxID=1849719 RepID=UPI000838CA01|nr:alpha/beta fold hydrolase [Saccharicrinis aurantiacus]